MEAREGDVISIIGVGLRLPGANDLDEVWQILTSDIGAIRPVPDGRLGFDGPADDNSRFDAGYLDDVAGFDAHMGKPVEPPGLIDLIERLVLPAGAVRTDPSA